MVMFLAAGCSKAERDQQEIQKTLSKRSNALNSKDLSQYVSAISIRYNDKGKDFKQIKESVEKNFSDFEQISFISDIPTIKVNGNSAESISNYRMKVFVHGKETLLNGTEHLRLEKENDGWKIVSGI